jgi:prevent-host-death family protein
VDTVPIRDAKVRFSALVEAAEHGQPTAITRHGRPAAVLVPVEDAMRLYPQGAPSSADLLLSFPAASSSGSMPNRCARWSFDGGVPARHLGKPTLLS